MYIFIYCYSLLDFIYIHWLFFLFQFPDSLRMLDIENNNLQIMDNSKYDIDNINKKVKPNKKRQHIKKYASYLTDFEETIRTIRTPGQKKRISFLFEAAAVGHLLRLVELHCIGVGMRITNIIEMVNYFC